MAQKFPEEIPDFMEVVSVTFPTGLVAETVVRQRTILPTGEYQITLWGKDFDGYDRTLTFRDEKWFATRPDTMEVVEVDLEFVDEN